MTVPPTITDTLTQGEMLPAGMDVLPGFVRCTLTMPQPDVEGRTIELQDRHGHTVMGWATRRFLRTLNPGAITFWTMPPGASRAICVEPVAWRLPIEEAMG